MRAGSIRSLWPGHTPIVREVTIMLRLVNEEPLRIGVGRGDVIDNMYGVNNPMLRLGQGGEPYIPGTSLKGVLRTASVLLSGMVGLPLHTAVFGDWCGAEMSRKLSLEFDSIRRMLYNNGQRSLMYELFRGFCPTCLAYGGPSVAGRVHVSDFYVNRKKKWSIGMRTSVAINRRTGSAAPGRLFTYEYVEPGAEFVGSMRLVNAPNWLIAFIAASLLLLDDGIVKVGGFKSRGMGKVSIVKNSVSIRLVDYGLDDASRIILDRGVDLPLNNIINNIGCRVGVDQFLTHVECVSESNIGWNFLKALADSWYSHYSSMIKSKYQERFNNIIKLLEDIVET